MSGGAVCQVERGRVDMLCDRMRDLRERQVVARNKDFGYLSAGSVSAFVLITWDRPADKAEPIDHCPFCGSSLKGE